MILFLVCSFRVLENAGQGLWFLLVSADLQVGSDFGSRAESRLYSQLIKINLEARMTKLKNI